jgi:hypothetical protein
LAAIAIDVLTHSNNCIGKLKTLSTSDFGKSLLNWSVSWTAESGVFAVADSCLDSFLCDSEDVQKIIISTLDVIEFA